MQELKSYVLNRFDDFVVNEVVLLPHTNTELTQCSCNDIFIYVLSGNCMIDTIYHDAKNSIVKSKNETYHISRIVWYQFKNDSDNNCQLLLISSR